MRTPVIDTCSGSIAGAAPLRISIRRRNIIVERHHRTPVNASNVEPVVIYFQGETSLQKSPLQRESSASSSSGSARSAPPPSPASLPSARASRSPLDRSRRWARSVSASAPITAPRRSTTSCRSRSSTTSCSAAGTSSKKTATPPPAPPACSNDRCSIRSARSSRRSSRCRRCSISVT